MEDEWRAVARSVPAILAPITAVDEAPTDSRLPNLLNRASNELRRRQDDMASFRRGVPNFVDCVLRNPTVPYVLLGRVNRALLDPTFPCVLLGRATKVLRHHHELHCAGARFLALYGERRGLLRPTRAIQKNPVFLPGLDQRADAEAWWENWRQNRRKAFNSKRKASRKLRLAAAYDIAASDAVSIGSRLPAGSPDRDPWIQAAEFLAVDAEAQTSAVLDHEFRMRRAVARESVSAAWIMSRT